MTMPLNELLVEGEALDNSPEAPDDSSYRFQINLVLERAARLDAWRRFFAKELHTPLLLAGTDLSIREYSSDDAFIEFPAATSEKDARAVIDGIRAQNDEPYEFVRRSLKDSRAWANLSLAHFVPCDATHVPAVQVSIRKHWQVNLADFCVRQHQKSYKRLTRSISSTTSSIPTFETASKSSSLRSPKV